MITIVDYGLGNIRAFVNVYNQLNMPIQVATKGPDLKAAAKILLPGVGSFDYAMQRLQMSGMRETLDEMVLEREVPCLGVCVGMQMLATSSEEGSLPGLGWINAKVKRFSFPASSRAISVPHMGWNSIIPVKRTALLEGLDRDTRFYFLHSYYFQSTGNHHVIAVTDYHGAFACAVNSGNVFGVQFHPEKSHRWGIRLLENFGNL